MTSAKPALPLWFKLAYTAFVAVLIPFYWATYGPTNFLFFCDVALFMGCVALWTENKLLASMPAAGIVLPQLLWCIDLACTSVGVPFAGMTGYMFNEAVPLGARILSLFHGWLPFALLFMVWKMGYDRRAFWNWTVVAWVLMFVCYFLMPAPPAPADNPRLPVNINFVYGPSAAGPQTWMDGRLYFVTMLVALPGLIVLPTHLALRKLFSRDAAAASS